MWSGYYQIHSKLKEIFAGNGQIVISEKPTLTSILKTRKI